MDGKTHNDRQMKTKLLLPLIAGLLLAGCASRTITMPDGTTVKSKTFLYKSAIQTFTFETSDGAKATLEGFTQETQADQIEAITRAAVKGAVDGATPLNPPVEPVEPAVPDAGPPTQPQAFNTLDGAPIDYGGSLIHSGPVVDIPIETKPKITIDME